MTGVLMPTARNRVSMDRPSTSLGSMRSRMMRSHGSAEARAGEGPARRTTLLGAFGDFDQVVAELCLDGALDHAHGGAEHDFVELADHFTAAEVAQGTAVAARRAAGVLARDLREVGAVLDRLLQFIALGFGVDEDVTGRGSCHGIAPDWLIRQVNALCYATCGVAGEECLNRVGPGPGSRPREQPLRRICVRDASR